MTRGLAVRESRYCAMPAAASRTFAKVKSSAMIARQPEVPKWMTDMLSTLYLFRQGGYNPRRMAVLVSFLRPDWFEYSHSRPVVIPAEAGIHGVNSSGNSVRR